MCWHSLTQQKITIIYVEEAIQDIADEIKFTNIEEINKCVSLLRKEVWKIQLREGTSLLLYCSRPCCSRHLHLFLRITDVMINLLILEL